MLSVFHIDQLSLPCVTRRFCEYTQRGFLLQALESSEELLPGFCFVQQGCEKAMSKPSALSFALKQADVFWKSFLETGAKDMAKFLLVFTQNLICETQSLVAQLLR